MRYIYFLLALLFFVGCAHEMVSLDPMARFVRIVTNEPSGCKYLGEVYGHQSSFLLNDSQNTRNAINSTKNEAYKLGGDTLYFLSNNQKTLYLSNDKGVTMLDSASSSINETNIVGLVYQCQ